MTRVSATLIALALGAATLSACADKPPSTNDDRNSTSRAGVAAPTFNCQERGTCGGPTAIPGTAATDAPGPRGNGRQ